MKILVTHQNDKTGEFLTWQELLSDAISASKCRICCQWNICFFSIYSAQILYGSDAAMNIKFRTKLDIVILYITIKSYFNSFRYQWNIWYFFLNGCADVISLKFYTKFEIVSSYQLNNYLIRGNQLFFFGWRDILIQFNCLPFKFPPMFFLFSRRVNFNSKKFTQPNPKRQFKFSASIENKHETKQMSRICFAGFQTKRIVSSLPSLFVNSLTFI